MGVYTEGNNRIFYKLSVEKETNVPSFNRQKKDNGVWVVSESSTTAKGYLKKIELDSYEYEGDTIEKFKMIFEDDDDRTSQFQIETGFNYLSRGILNTLAGADSINHVKIRLYVDKKGFPAAYLEINKQKGGWKYKPDEVPKAKEVKVGNKTLKDYTELDAFFKDLISEINNKIVSEQEVESEMTQRTAPQNQPEKKGYTSELAKDNVSDDLPFAIALLFTLGTLLQTVIV